MRLPTEVEWEYACRAGTRTPFSFGANITSKQVNYDGNRPYAGGAKGKYREKTVTVKSLPPNPWGLFEMHGNVWEWCEDKYAGECRVARGGAWYNDAGYVRSADRYWDLPSFRNNSLGFRFARD